MLKQTISATLFFIMIFNIATAIEHPSIKIPEYDSELIQAPGTTKSYQVEVENTGDVPLDSAYLTLFFLPSSWYKFESGVRLEVNEKKILNYSLSIPSDASGSISYDLTANAIRGFGIVSNSTVNVGLKIQKEETIQTTTITETTTQTPISSQSEISSIKIFDSYIWLIVLVLAVSLAISLAIYKLI